MKKTTIIAIMFALILSFSGSAFAGTAQTASITPQPSALVALCAGMISLAGFVSRREERR